MRSTALFGLPMMLAANSMSTVVYAFPDLVVDHQVSPAPVAAVEFLGEPHVFYRASNGCTLMHAHPSTFPGTMYVQPLDGPGAPYLNATSDCLGQRGIHAIVHQGKIFLFYTNDDNRDLHYAVFDGLAWTHHGPLDGHVFDPAIGSTDVWQTDEYIANPAAVSGWGSANRLDLFYEVSISGYPNLIMHAWFDGIVWSLGDIVDGVPGNSWNFKTDTPKNRPAPVVFNGDLHVFYGSVSAPCLSQGTGPWLTSAATMTTTSSWVVSVVNGSACTNYGAPDPVVLRTSTSLEVVSVEQTSATFTTSTKLVKVVIPQGMPLQWHDVDAPLVASRHVMHPAGRVCPGGTFHVFYSEAERVNSIWQPSKLKVTNMIQKHTFSGPPPLLVSFVPESIAISGLGLESHVFWTRPDAVNNAALLYGKMTCGDTNPDSPD